MRMTRLVDKSQGAQSGLEKPVPAMDWWKYIAPKIDGAVHSLPEEYRGTVILCGLAGQNLAQAARQLGLDVHQARWRLSAGLQLLAARVGRRDLPVTPRTLFALLSRNAVPASISSRLVQKTLQRALEASPPGDSHDAVLFGEMAWC
jgi:hypothetical protein